MPEPECQLASYAGKEILMAAVAYRRPLSAETQKDFDKLNVRDTVQEVIECSKCKGEYVLVYPVATDAAILAEYRNAIERYCGSKHPRIRLNF